MSRINNKLFDDSDTRKIYDNEPEGLFADESEETTGETGDKWKVLVVDDEEDVHSITSLSLNDFSYKNKKINLIDAYSAAEARKILQDEPDIAVILLDVVMETTDAGLVLTEYIRNELENSTVRIVLRTGQPGYAPEVVVITNYDINDYQAKADLTENRLYTVITAGLRAYEALKQIEEYSHNLERMVEERTRKIELQKQEIIQSILYASRIQDAVLPVEEEICEALPENFIFFKPRDIVSGDFYWITRKNKKVVLTAADCTGHGVPGAFMSMLGMTLLNEIVNKNEIIQANEILNRLRNEVIASLKQTGKDGEAKDGMDIALCVIDLQNLTLQYAGAYNPLFIVRKNGNNDVELIELKADRMPIGIYFRENNPFTNREIQLQKNDCLYMFSDGYTDQFGGEYGRKFMSRRFKQLLQDIAHLQMPAQKSVIEKTLNQWMGEKYDQVDDIVVLGARV